MTDERDIIRLGGGPVAIAVDPGAAVYLKCVTPPGDPVELNAEQLKELCTKLQELIAVIE